MGLTIHYKLRLPARTAATEVRQKIDALHGLALDLPFKEVTPVLDLTGTDCDPEQSADKERRSFLSRACDFIFYDCPPLQPSPQRRPFAASKSLYNQAVPPRRLIGFSAWPGQGCMSAIFGLSLFPASATVRGHWGRARLSTGLTGWRWRTSCKTIYASNPEYGGLENFVRCHTLVVRLLDAAKALGIGVEVNDESDYYQHRDLEKLVQAADGDLQGLAALFGRLKDIIGDNGGMVAPVAKRPDFERLEARGRRAKRGTPDPE